MEGPFKMVEQNLTAWIFQYNPKLGFDLMQHLKQRDFRPSEPDTWSVNQHRQRIKQGDEIYFWKTQPNAGIYVIGRVMSDPFTIHEYNRFGGVKCYVRFDYVLNQPVLRKHLSQDPEFANLSILRNPKGTNFPVSAAERKAFWECFQFVGLTPCR